MENGGKKIQVIFETIQWLLLVFVIVVCLFVCPKVKQHMIDESEQHLYERIHTDKQIERLNRENLILIDSLSNATKDTVYLVEFKTIRQTVYVDTSN